MFKFLKSLLGRGPAVTNVTPFEAEALVRQGAMLLDVRSAAERRTAKIRGSTHLPLDDLGRRADTLPRDRVIVCQCASGHRSALAAKHLAAAGFDVRNLQGGIQAWQAAGLPTQ
ncbi:rhodanese-like domain-containing protein [Deinococcus enclensis]|uniref:Rhodanese-related sulfurtransferase n=1 Tax=Deinococcus enclensis TaxID=1049582 RepID=A0ABT9MCI4_9DEIO|nr:rhodanese-like domain-containing protein [Deinococcus enclensis]MDP9764214.1 rhodanese-related sulfurtransferase [Deinococcus enclensis]